MRIHSFVRYSWIALLVGALPAIRADLLDDHLKRLRADAEGARKETGMLSAGADFLYGQEYFEAGNFSSAVWYFRDAVKKEENNPFFRYQLGAALLKSGDKNVEDEARKHLEAAVRLQPALRERSARDFPARPPAPPAASPNPPANPPAPTARADGKAAAPAASVQAYVDRLKRSRAAGGPETAMNTPGREALYGIEYFEKHAYDSAETGFALALGGDPANPHLNYLMAVARAAQGKDAAAQLQRAVAGDPALRAQFDGEVAIARAAWRKVVEAGQPKTTPPAPEPPAGGALVFGNYVCSETVWNGPNAVPAFRREYRGYFALRSDGTYRWLDNGATGRYRYDPQSGVVTWLSGFFAGGGAPRSTVYRRSGDDGLMSITFSDTLRWNVICEKK